MTFKNNAIAFLMVGMFAFAMLSFSVGFVVVNGGNRTIFDDERYGVELNNTYDDLKEKLGSSYVDSNQSLTVLKESEQTVDQNILLDSVGKIWTTMVSIPIDIFNLIFIFAFKMLFGSAYGLVATTISSIIIVLVIIYVWKWVRTGDPD